MRDKETSKPTEQSNARINRRTKRCVILVLVGLCVGVIGYFSVGASVRRSSTKTLYQADRFLLAKDAIAVRRSLKWLLWFEPDHHEALLLWGLSLHIEQRHQEAIDILIRIPEGSKSFEEAATTQAVSLILDDQLERAETILVQVLERFPHADVARVRLLKLYMGQLRKRDAIKLVMDRWKGKVHDLTVLPDLLLVRTDDSTPQIPAINLERADKRHPNQATVVLALAHANWLMGNVETARTRFETAVRLRPQHPGTRILATEFFIESGDIAEARKLLPAEKTLNTLQDSASYTADDRYWWLRSRLAEQTGDIKVAYVYIQKALMLRPKELAYVGWKAGLLRRLGQLDEAAEASREFAQLGYDEKRLLILHSEMDRQHPTVAQCREVADILDRVGRPDQAAGWRLVMENVAHSGPVRVSPPGSRMRPNVMENRAP